MNQQNTAFQFDARFNPNITEVPANDSSRLCFVFSGDKALLVEDSQVWQPISLEKLEQLGLEMSQELCFGAFDGCSCVAYELQNSKEEGNPNLPAGCSLVSLYSLLLKVDESVFALLGRAKQLLAWQREQRFCGCCGRATQPSKTDRSLVCADCGVSFYPRLSPCAIFLITRGDEILLARNKNFPEGMYSTLAGFVEPGETVEQTVQREAFEEVGLQVGEPRFFSSQPWPFPHQLMLGFFTDYIAGQIHPDGEEIVEAQWFPRSQLPQVPGDYALSGRLISHYCSPPPPQ